MSAENVVTMVTRQVRRDEVVVSRRRIHWSVGSFDVLARLFLFCFAALTVFHSDNAIAQDRMITLVQFDGWIFSRMQNEQKARETLISRIDFEVDRIERIASLTEEQKAKIRLAGTGDVKHFFDEVRVARRKFIELGDVPQNQINEAYQLASPLAQRLNLGLFDADSLLKKVARTAPDPEQAEIIRQEVLRRQQQQKKYAIKAYVAILGRTIPLTSMQRAQLIETIEECVEIKNSKTPYIAQIVAYRMSQVPEERFRNMLDDNQFDAIKKMFDQAKALRPMLIEQGLIDDE